MWNLATAVAAVMLLQIASTASSAQESRPDRRFQQWDRNGDGKLNRGEIPEPARRNFDRVDTDGDGFISVTEHLNFVQRRGSNNARPADSRRDARISDRVELKRDLPYAATNNPRQMLDLLLPKQRVMDDPLPVVAFIHGGAWRAGDKRTGIGRVARFAESGQFVAASIGYRLSGEAQWPAQIHDCKAAIRWLKAHAKEYGFDPNRICVFGTSAGGHLVAMLGVSGDVKALDGKLGPHIDFDSRVACVVDFFGPTELLTMNDFESRIDHDAPDSPESQLIGGPIQENKLSAKAASPITYVSTADAPVLIMHGTKDPLVPYDQSVQFEKALNQANVDAILVAITDGGHGFGGSQVNERIDQFLKKYLLVEDVELSTEPIEP